MNPRSCWQAVLVVQEIPMSEGQSFVVTDAGLTFEFLCGATNLRDDLVALLVRFRRGQRQSFGCCPSVFDLDGDSLTRLRARNRHTAVRTNGEMHDSCHRWSPSLPDGASDRARVIVSLLR